VLEESGDRGECTNCVTANLTQPRDSLPSPALFQLPLHQGAHRGVVIDYKNPHAAMEGRASRLGIRRIGHYAEQSEQNHDPGNPHADYDPLLLRFFDGEPFKPFAVVCHWSPS
jgi:hypothetical protein